MTTQTSEEILEEQVGIADEKPPFSLELNQDQKDIKEWVHGFAEDVVRPAAHEWDEKEEFPWPVVEEPPRSASTASKAPRSSSPTSPASRCRSSTRSCSGAMPASAWPSWEPASRSPRSSARARPSRWANGSRSATAPRTTSRSPRSAPPSPTPAPTSPPSAPPPSTTKSRTNGRSTARRHGPPTVVSPTSTS